MMENEPNDLYKNNLGLVYEIIINDYKYTDDPGIEHDLNNIGESDFIQIGKAALWRASRRYKRDPAMFGRYAAAAIRNAIISQLRTSTRQRPDGSDYAAEKLNIHVEVDEWSEDIDEEGEVYAPDPADYREMNPLDRLIAEEEGFVEGGPEPEHPLLAEIRAWLRGRGHDDPGRVLNDIQRQDEGEQWRVLAAEAGVSRGAYRQRMIRLKEELDQAFGDRWKRA